jgi:dolichyl-diphosphooligosaccharide--protein glycosyltransferase
VKISKLFNKEKIVDSLSSVGALRLRVTHSTLLHISLLVMILVITGVIRLLPMRWGLQLSEFDPHVHYRLTKYIVDNGFFSWTSWVDTMAWYPQGINVGTNVFPGLAATAATFYKIADALNLAPAPILTADFYHPLNADPVFNFTVIFPVIMAVFTVLVIYFLARDIGGKEVGLFSAFFLALNSPNIARTSLGFFDDETVGIFGLLLFMLFFLRSIDPEKSLRSSIAYGVLGGLSLGYLFSSWGAARYALGITLIFVFVLILIRRYSTRLLLSFSTTFGISLLIAVNIPKLGFNFLTEPTVLAVFGMFLLLGIYEMSSYIKTSRNKFLFIIAFLTLLVVLFVGLSNLGLIGSLQGKFISVIFPNERLGEGIVQELIQSVAEHRPATWGSFYFDVGIGVLFMPVGLYFAIQNPSNRNIYLVIFGLSSIYFASSMARLNQLMAPAISILWALALVQVVRPFVTILREKSVIPRRKMRFRSHVGKEFSAAFIILMFLLLTVTFVLPGAGADFPRSVSRAYAPTTIASASLPLVPNQPIRDWLDTLNWIRVNLESSDVAASWWDYGYWLTNIGNVTTLADNGTINSTQISSIGQMFISNETEAIKFLEEYNVSYIVVFHSFRQDSDTGQLIDATYGDEGKWRWMARIGGLDDNQFGNHTLGYDWYDTNENGADEVDELIPNELGQSTVLFKLMHHARETVAQGISSIELDHFVGPPEGYFSQEVGNIISYPDSLGSFAPIVAVYKVNYD